jgi:glycosyltransferase involved in cell wall biosynthesis
LRNLSSATANWLGETMIRAFRSWIFTTIQCSAMGGIWLRHEAKNSSHRSGWFTGLFFRSATEAAGHEVVALQDNLTDKAAVGAEVMQAAPDAVVNLEADSLFSPQDATKTQSVLQGLSLTHGHYLPAVGTLEPRKNLQVALEAYASLPAKLRERFPLVLVGIKGWKTSGLEQKLAPMVARGQVRQLGYLTREELAKVMAGATAMVYPPVFEGFGLPKQESMACAVPVIASNASSISEVVGDSGLLIDPLDAQAPMHKMAQFLENAVFKAQLADKALARSQLFSWAKCTNQTVDVYKAAVA